jgi:hypothetical protein
MYVCMYLKRIKKRANDYCWVCEGRATMTGSHVLLHCPSTRMSARQRWRLGREGTQEDSVSSWPTPRVDGEVARAGKMDEQWIIWEDGKEAAAGQEAGRPGPGVS